MYQFLLNGLIFRHRRDDLIVGAPFYYTSTSSGAVYVYMNNDGGFVENHPYTKIEGLSNSVILFVVMIDKHSRLKNVC